MRFWHLSLARCLFHARAARPCISICGVWLALLLMFSSFAVHSQPRPDLGTEEELLAKIEELHFQRLTDEGAALKQVTELLETMDRKAMPRAWIRGLSWDIQNVDKYFQGDFEVLLQSALDLKETPSYIRLLLMKAKQLQTLARAARAEITLVYSKARHEACDVLNEAVLCADVWQQESNYYYDIKDIPQCLSALNTAMSLVKDLPGRSRVYYYLTRGILAATLYSRAEYGKAIEIEDENLLWFKENGFIGLAANSAGNIAATFIKTDSTAVEKIHRYLDIAQELATQVEDYPQIAYVERTRGLLLMKQEKPDFAAARLQFERSSEIYKKLK
ncbi:MAG: hypothetical protein M3Q07_12165, partial [Pseudobdellovibrionaceae bacterium]|nr:hypothetical protein [Pseudobdellovibrionaceae bacterium]